mgnify:CR=1 FL=1
MLKSQATDSPVRNGDHKWQVHFLGGLRLGQTVGVLPLAPLDASNTGTVQRGFPKHSNTGTVEHGRQRRSKRGTGIVGYE